MDHGACYLCESRGRSQPPISSITGIILINIIINQSECSGNKKKGINFL